MKNEIKNSIKENKLIAIVRGVEPETCVRIAQALYDGGFRLMEITYDQKHPETWESTAQTIGAVAEAFAGRMYIGAGTVTCPELVELTHKYGGRFIISPDMNEAVITRTCELGMVSIPGALTPTEITSAHRAGADFVKLFPAGVFGASYIKAVKAPLKHIPVTAVGGVTPQNCAEFFKAGACGVGVGGNLVSPELVNAGRFDEITALAKAYSDALAQF